MNRISMEPLLSSHAKGNSKPATQIKPNDPAFSSILAAQMGKPVKEGAAEPALPSLPVSGVIKSLLAAQNTDAAPEADKQTDAKAGASSGDMDTKSLILLLLAMMFANASGEEGGMGSLMTSIAATLSGQQKDGAGAGLMNVMANGTVNVSDIVSNLPASEKGPEIVQAAMTRLGDPYSRAKRGTGNYVDCSSLTKWAYAQAGISIPSTSVSQAKYCYEKGYMISKDELKPGDLVFLSKTSCSCGRWNEIHHVGIYAGNNKVIEASSSNGKVVIRDLWGEDGGKWKIFGYARPQ